MQKSEKPQIIYVLPNLITAASCFFGVISAISSINGSFSKAIFFIFISLVLDGLDGRVARFTHTTSKFGLEFDSLADIIAFGVAPATLFYCSIGGQYGRIGALATALFVVFGAIRLARFNITSSDNEPNVFIGLPIPTAALTLSVWVYFYTQKAFMSGTEFLFIALILFLSFLMVSNIRYPSFKKINFKKGNFLKVLVISIVLFALFYLRPLEFCMFVTTVYIIYGVLRAIYNLFIVKLLKK